MRELETESRQACRRGYRQFNSLELLELVDTEAVAYFRAFCDESGVDDATPFVIVGGALGKKQKWFDLVVEWKKVLRRYRLPRFHATDFNTRNDESKNWDEAKRHSFIDSLLGLISEAQVIGIACVIEKELYNKLLTEFKGTNLSPYQFCCYSCAAQVIAARKYLRTEQPIELVYAKKRGFHSVPIDDLSRELNTAWMTRYYFGISRISQQEADKCVQLQVADLIIYELLKGCMRLKRGTIAPPRHIAVQLNKIMRGSTFIMDEPRMRHALRAFSENYSSGAL